MKKLLQSKVIDNVGFFGGGGVVPAHVVFQSVHKSHEVIRKKECDKCLRKYYFDTC